MNKNISPRYVTENQYFVVRRLSDNKELKCKVKIVHAHVVAGNVLNEYVLSLPDREHLINLYHDINDKVWFLNTQEEYQYVSFLGFIGDNNKM